MMPTILYGKPVAQSLHEKLTSYRQEHAQSDDYLAIILLGDNSSSEVYVRMKQKLGASIGLSVQVLREQQLHALLGSAGSDSQLTTEEVIASVQQLNADRHCVGMIMQLPLPAHLLPYTNQIYAHVDPYKDVDGLGGRILGLAQLGLIDFLPATAGAVMSILAHYQLDDVQGKHIALVGQSNLLGKPLAAHLMNQGATVYSFNEYSDQSKMRELCQQSDYIVSCTGVVHLIDQGYVRDDQSQIVIDVGYGHRDGKAVGDVDFDAIVDKVAAITPVPGGVGPLTVTQLFVNAMQLHRHR